MPTLENRGHVTVTDDDGQPIATLLDLGGMCAVDAMTSHLTPDQAFEYGSAVLRWACRKRIEARNGEAGSRA